MLRVGSTAAPPSDVPPIRGQPKKGPESEQEKVEAEGTHLGTGDGEQRKGKNAASHTYDYFRDKWDKFDMVSCATITPYLTWLQIVHQKSADLSSL